MECASVTSRKRVNTDYNNVSATKTNTSHAIPSIQLTYVCPDYESKKIYGANDVAPFIVHVSKSDSESGPTLRPMEFGQFLYKNNVKNIKMDGLKRVGRNRISIEFDTAVNANSFLTLPIITSAGYVVAIPSYSISRMGMVRDVPVEWSMEELVNNLNVPSGFGTVVKARRLSRKSFNDQQQPTWIPTRSVVLTFSGQKLPPRVYCYFTSLPVETYLLPTIQCNKCCRFGHIKAQCRSQPRCFKCGQSHDGETCVVVKPSCLFCSGAHAATYSSCPEHVRQKDIKLVMSQESISYMEASARFPHVRRSFADSAKSSPSVIPTTHPKPHSLTPTSSSYKKTVYTPRRPPPTVSRGYNQQAHRNIIQTPTSQLPNGCGFPSNDDLSPNDNFLETLIITLTQILSRFSDVGIPSKAREDLTQLLNVMLNNGSISNNPVELS